MRPRSARGFAPWIGCAVVVLASSARAEEQPSASDIALARTLGGEGVQLAEQGNCAAAVDKLQRAETLYHAPTILVRLGECQVALGRVVTGTENLQRVVREALPPRAPKPFVDAQVRAQKSLEAALPKLAKLKIHVEAPPTAKPTVKLDGESVSLAALDVDRPADPGNHRVEVSAPGFRTASVNTTLREGLRDSVSLTLEPDAGAAVSGAPPTAVGQAPSPSPLGVTSAPGDVPAPAAAPPVQRGVADSTGASKVPAYVLLAAGGVGIAVGTGFGLSAIGKKGTLSDTCTDGSSYCPTSAQDDIDSIKSAATVSTIAFVAGGAAAGAGLLWLLLSKSPGEGNARREGNEARVRPFVGPASAGVWGSF